MPTPIQIRQIRHRLAMTQRELALALGIDGPAGHRTIQDWEAGRRTPPEYLAMALAELLRARP
jgi:DNA-binding transcriptional regulator YiaG